jgi:hypothetical protein
VPRSSARICGCGGAFGKTVPCFEPVLMVTLMNACSRGEHLANVGSTCGGVPERHSNLEVKVGVG